MGRSRGGTRIPAVLMGRWWHLFENGVRGEDTIQEGCIHGALGRSLLGRPGQLYLSLSSRVTRLVMRPHMSPTRNRMQMLPLMTDRM